MSEITELQIILQRPIDEDELPVEHEGLKVFATQGQSSVRQYARVGAESYVENTLITAPCNIQVGVAGIKDLVKRSVLRILALNLPDEKDWRYFYVIARFKLRDGSETFRTIIPRTEITVEFRSLRHRDYEDRELRSKPSRDVRRKKVSGVQRKKRRR